ncbi:MAG: proton-conducting transporter membrane subunit [Bdellovibrionota bacterium]
MIHPLSLFLILFPVFLFSKQKWIQATTMVVSTLLCFAWFLEWSWPFSWHGFFPSLFAIDSVQPLQKLFATTYLFVLATASVYSWTSSHKSEVLTMIFHALMAIGVVLAQHWIEFFVYWELMSLASFFIVWMGPGKSAKSAGLRYLIYHSLGGGMLMVGVAWAIRDHLPFSYGSIHHPAQLFILFSCLINAACFPFHTWIKDAYPKASIFGSVILSVFVTKTSVYALIRFFPGFAPLVVIGAFMALFGAIYALMENNIRRLLSYHIVSQVGFMVCGVGLGTTLSLQGSAAHAVCHILYKSLLFMSAGAVVHAIGREKISSLGNLGKALPWVFCFYMIGAVSISGFPFFNGYVSKSMVIEAAHQYAWLAWTLKAASVGTFLSVGLKLPYYTFIKNNHTDYQPTPLPRSMIIAMAVVGLMCFVVGVFPDLLYSRLPGVVDFHPYDWELFLTDVSLLGGVGLGFWIAKIWLTPSNQGYEDVDTLILFPLAKAGKKIVNALKHINTWMLATEKSTYQKMISDSPSDAKSISFSIYMLLIMVCLLLGMMFILL